MKRECRCAPAFLLQMEGFKDDLPVRYCTACGAEIGAAALFCERCGKLVPRADGTLPELTLASDRRRRRAAELAYRQKRRSGCFAVALELLLTAIGIAFLIWFLAGF